MLKRSLHSLSHTQLTTGDMGELIPVGAVEVIPGDTFRHRSAMLLRVAPLAKPVMHPVEVKLHHWYVPYRILWDGWEDMITGKVPVSTSPIPTVTVPVIASRSYLLDNLGVDPNCETDTINALPVRAYNKIWNEFYRDQDLDTEIAEDQVVLQRVKWEKDYFTVARPTPQQGDSVEISFSAGEAPIKSDATPGTDYLTVEDGTGTPRVMLDDSTAVLLRNIAASTPNDPLVADLSQATAGIDIASWREAMAFQRMREARSRYGSRYVDYLRYCGVNPSDGRLQRPEYLGGGKNTVSFSEVLSTGDAGTAALGDLAGHGIMGMRTRTYRRFFEEHGIVLSLAFVRPRTMYPEALDKMWLRSDLDEYYQKEFSILGQQELKTAEVYGPHANRTDVFGYIDRHNEYRRQHSKITGKFRDSSDYDWHYGRLLGTSPTLNSSFVTCNPSDRMYQDASEPEVKMQVAHQIAARRPVAKRARA